MKTRIEVNQEGELYIVIPDHIVEDLQIDDGDTVSIQEVDGEVILTFQKIVLDNMLVFDYNLSLM